MCKHIKITSNQSPLIFLIPIAPKCSSTKRHNEAVLSVRLSTSLPLAFLHSAVTVIEDLSTPSVNVGAGVVAYISEGLYKDLNNAIRPKRQRQRWR